MREIIMTVRMVTGDGSAHTMCSPQAPYAFPIAKVFHDDIAIQNANPSQVQRCKEMQDRNAGMIW